MRSINSHRAKRALNSLSKAQVRRYLSSYRISKFPTTAAPRSPSHPLPSTSSHSQRSSSHSCRVSLASSIIRLLRTSRISETLTGVMRHIRIVDSPLPPSPSRPTDRKCSECTSRVHVAKITVVHSLLPEYRYMYDSEAPGGVRRKRREEMEHLLYVYSNILGEMQHFLKNNMKKKSKCIFEL